MDIERQTSKKQIPQNSRRGLVLVVVLWVLVLLALLTLTLAQNTRLDNAVRASAKDRITARWLARAGVYQAMDEIAGDRNSTDYLEDYWSENENVFKEVELAQGRFSVVADRFESDSSFTYGVCDEASKLNLNTASRKALLALPEMTEELADVILDWRKGSHNPTEVKSVASASERIELGIRMPGRMFGTIRELALVEGMNREILYAEDANLNGYLDHNEKDGAAQEPPDDQNEVLKRGLLSYVTVNSFDRNQDEIGRPRLNLNTVDKNTLTEELGLEEGHVNWILERQALGFESIADLLQASTIQPDDFSSEVKGAKGMADGMADKKKKVIKALDWKTFRRITDRIAVTDEAIIPGRININTAGREVLMTLPGVDATLAESILEKRASADYPEGFTSVAEIMYTPGITLETFKEIAELITVRSNVFTIRSCGEADRSGMRHYVETVVARTRTDLTVLYWKESR
jgi:DNA uptake protein ComE-like DNA-binding protein